MPIEQLKPIRLSEINEDSVYNGRFLACRTITDGVMHRETGTMALVEDLSGDVEEVGLFNFRRSLNDGGKWLTNGTIMLIKEPYLTEEKAMLGNSYIRVDSPSDVIFIDETDLKSLETVGAQKWYAFL